MPNSAVAILSGGLDSTTMVYDAINRGIEIKRAISFNYGQKHVKELDYARNTAAHLMIPHTTIDLWSSGFTEALMANRHYVSSLIDTNADVPDGHYSEESMKSTVVPNRNMIMISIAGGIAVADQAECVLVGVHAGDHAIYPDCRPHFIETVSHALMAATVGFNNFNNSGSVLAPYMTDSKAQIARTALMLGVPLESTWSCYKGGEIHCGRCGTCVERLEAIYDALSILDDGTFQDRTEYADTDFWRYTTEGKK